MGCCRGYFRGGDLRGDDLKDDLVDLIDGAVVVDGDDALGFAGGDVLVAGVDAAVEVVGLALEAVLVGALGLDAALVAAAGAVEGGFDGGRRRRVRSGWRLSQTAAWMARMRRSRAGGHRPGRPRRSRCSGRRGRCGRRRGRAG